MLQRSRGEGGVALVQKLLLIVFVLYPHAQLTANIDSARYYFECGKPIRALSFMDTKKYQAYSFTDKERWLKLKFDIDLENGDIEGAKQDVLQLEQLRVDIALERYYRAEHLAMWAYCYHVQIKADSAIDYSIEALRLYRKEKPSADSLDVFRIYWAHASASRNNFEKAYGLAFSDLPGEKGLYDFARDYIPACFDTAIYFLKKSPCKSLTTLSKLYRSKANYYLDYSNKRDYSKPFIDKEFFFKHAFSNYIQANRILQLVKPLPRKYLAYNEALIGLLHHFHKDYKRAFESFDQSQKHLDQSMLEARDRKNSLYTQLILDQFKSIVSIELFIEKGDENQLKSCIEFNLHSIGDYIRFLSQINAGLVPFRDVYNVNPLRRLVECYIKLHSLTGQSDYFDAALYFMNLNNGIANGRIATDSLNHLADNFMEGDKTINYRATRQGLQRNLNKNECMLLYWDSNTHLYEGNTLVFILEKDRQTIVFSENKTHSGYNSISMKGQPIFNLLKDSTAACIKYYLAAASKIYYHNIKSSISPTVTKLILVPNKELSFLPFEMLHYVDKGKTHYLIEKFAVSYLTVPTDLMLDRRRKQSINDLVVFNNTISSRGEVMFPFSNSTAQVLWKRFSSGLYQPSLNKSSFIKKCRDSTVSVVVFSHASSDPNNLARSYLLLGKDTLAIKDIANQRFNSPLLSLMACELDYGNYDVNAGKLSMSAVLLQRGVKSILTTQWMVDDKVCALLAQSFYKHLFNGFTAAEALRLAKLELIGSSGLESAPLYWAPFRLVGPDISVKEVQLFSINWLVAGGVCFALLIFVFLYIKKKRAVDN